MQEDDAEHKAQTSSNNSSETSFFQGVKPKVSVSNLNGNKKFGDSSKSISNGFTSHNKKTNSVYNGAACSSSMSPTSSSTSSPSTSSSVCSKSVSAGKNVVKGRTYSSEEYDTKANDKKRKTGSVLDHENLNENEGEDGLSEDDYCIYTYKGDQFADLPNSFYRVEIGDHEGENQNVEEERDVNEDRRHLRENREGSNPGSSPEMDYLEMDFDPGPSAGQDSGDEVDSFDQNSTSNSPLVDVCMKNNVENQEGDKSDNSPNNISPEPGPSDENHLYCSSFNGSLSSAFNFNRTKETFDSNFPGLSSSEDKTDKYSDTEHNIKDEKLEFMEDSYNLVSSKTFGGRRLVKKYLLTESKDSNIFKKVSKKFLILIPKIKI